MKNLIILLVLFSFVLAPFNTNAGNIDYSKTEIKVSGKNYTLTKIKDLLYKNIINKVNLKQTESLKIDSYNSFIKTLDKIIIQAKKSSKTQNIHLGYMLEDLKQTLNLDLEKITNKTTQIEDKKEVLENANIDGVKFDENFKITTSMDYKLANNLLSETNKAIYNKYYKIAENLYNKSNGIIKYNIDLSDLINNSENKLIDGVDSETIKNQRIKTSENGKSKLTKIVINFTTDGMGIEIVEYYDNGQYFGFGYTGMGYSEAKATMTYFREFKANVTRINHETQRQNFIYSQIQDGVKLDEKFKIETSLNAYIKQGIITKEHQIINDKYIKIAENLYKKSNGTIKYDIDLSDLINNSENKLVDGIDNEEIKNQRIKTSENGKAKLTKIKISFQGDGMGVEVIEYYSNGNYFGFGYAGMGLIDVKGIIAKNGEFTAGITQINGYKPGQWIGEGTDPFLKFYYKTAK